MSDTKLYKKLHVGIIEGTNWACLGKENSIFKSIWITSPNLSVLGWSGQNVACVASVGEGEMS